MQTCIQAPSYPPIPKIEFRSLSEDTINQSDFFNLVLYFEDGNGDLGRDADNTTCTNLCLPEENESSCFKNKDFSVFVTDKRTGCLIASGRVIPNIPSKGSSNAISGEMTIRIGSVCCFDGINGGCVPLPNLPVDELNMDVKIRDQAGNFSNTLTVGSVKILCN